MDHRPYQKNFVGSELSAPLNGLLGQDFDRGGSSLHNTYSCMAAPSAQYSPTSMPALSNQQSHLGFSSAEPASYVDEGKFLLPYQDCNAMVLLNSLIFLEQKIHDLQNVVKSMIQYGPDDGFLIRKQVVMADTASIIIQLVATTMRLFPVDQQQSFRGNLESNINPVIAYLGSIVGAASELGLGNLQQIESETPIVATGIANGCLDFSPPLKLDNQVKRSVFPIQGSEPGPADLGFTGDKKDWEDNWEEENLSPCSYEVLELKKEEILAPHAHFCSICGKGFKRDANRRMHMRGHGDEYKTPQALAKPNEEASLCPVRSRRYSCPFEGCKRNRKHKKFLPLKTILCVKNHYRRSHCDKSYVCSKCNSKKFSVIADLKTHEKHCGQDNWLCSCGTTFSRKDKLFGHVALFQGHRPMILVNEVKGYVATDEPVKAERTKIGNASSSNLACEAGSKRVVFARREDKKQNLLADCFDTIGMATRSPLTYMGASVSLQASPSGNFIESNGGNPNCGCL